MGMSSENGESYRSCVRKRKEKNPSKQVALGLFRFAGERRREKRVALFS